MKLRITSGSLGGRIIRLPELGIRPTKDMVRQAIFSALAGRIPGARVLELFAGSGVQGFEALSRGAAHVCWVEKNTRVLAALRSNAQALLGREMAGTAVMGGDALQFLSRYQGEPFDIVLADPPYDRDGTELWLGKTLQILGGRPILARSGILVFEQGSSEAPGESPDWRLVRDRCYGDTRLLFYEASKPEASE